MTGVKRVFFTYCILDRGLQYINDSHMRRLRSRVRHGYATTFFSTADCCFRVVIHVPVEPFSTNDMSNCRDEICFWDIFVRATSITLVPKE